MSKNTPLQFQLTIKFFPTFPLEVMVMETSIDGIKGDYHVP
jgi:hypothetical protein